MSEPGDPARAPDAPVAPAQPAGRASGAQSGQSTLLAVQRLRRTFGDFVAVDDVSFSVGPGEVVGLLGANGAGKTTALRMALGLLAPSSGHSVLLGQRPDREVRRWIGYVPQGLGLYANLSVRENLAFVADVYGRSRPELPEVLTGMRDALVGTISLGSQRELAFACALLHEPKLLVLDEPTSGVSALSSRDLWATIHGRADAGVGVLVTTHNMQEAQQCDRLLLMSGGRLVGQGSEAELVAGTSAVRVEVADWAGAFDLLSRLGLPVTLAGTSVRVAGVALDEVAHALSAGGMAAEVSVVPATIEERMVLLNGANTPG
ncbi:MAG: ABC transporter ATP-binding protein [Candidatus Nanopelagicales bacterium]